MNINRPRPPKDGDVALWLSGLINDGLRDAQEAGLCADECCRIAIYLAQSMSLTCLMNQTAMPTQQIEASKGAVLDIIKERVHQLNTWGTTEHDLPTWATILGGEYGEVCSSVLQERFDDLPLEDLRHELVQLAAVALAMIQGIDNNSIKSSWGGPNDETT